LQGCVNSKTRINSSG